MNSKIKNLIINYKGIEKINKLSNIPCKDKNVKINTSSKSKVKILGRRDN